MRVEPKEMNFRDRDLVFVDLETTGLDPESHEIIEVGCVVADGRTLEIKRKYEKKTKPVHIESADPGGLKVSGYSEERWKAAVSLREALEEFGNIAPDGMLVGWNITFDWLFLDKAFKKFEIKPSFDYHRIDAMSIAFALLHQNKNVQRLGLRKVAPIFGIELSDKFHGALEDAHATYLIFKELMKDKL